MGIAWVTGGRGFIGRRLVLALRERGMTVCGVGHGHLPAESWIEAGLSGWLNASVGPEALSQIAALHGAPESVFHLAGGSTVGASLQAPFEDFTRTTHTTASLLEWLRTNSPRTRLIVASSAAVYGEARVGKPGEARRPMPVSPYGYHKLMMEQLCQEYSHVFGLQIGIVRLFSVFGDGLRKQLLWDCAGKLLASGEAIELGGTGAELRDWVHVDDAVSMLELAGRHASRACPIFDGGTGTGVPVREVVTLLAAALQSPKRIEFSGHGRPGDPTALVADASRIQAAGHVCQVGLAEGIRRYAAWFKLCRNT